MTKYRKKPVVIEAWQFTLENAAPQPDWLRKAFASGEVYYQGGDEPYLTVKTSEGQMRASLLDWIIRGVEGEIYPCKPSVFEETYTLVEEPTGELS